MQPSPHLIWGSDSLIGISRKRTIWPLSQDDTSDCSLSLFRSQEQLPLRAAVPFCSWVTCGTCQQFHVSSLHNVWVWFNKLFDDNIALSFLKYRTKHNSNWNMAPIFYSQQYAKEHTPHSVCGAFIVIALLWSWRCLQSVFRAIWRSWQASKNENMISYEAYTRQQFSSIFSWLTLLVSFL